MTRVRRWGLAALAAAGCAAESTPKNEPGTLYVTDRGGDAILRYDAVTGAFRDVFASGEAAHVDRPSSVRMGPDGHIYLAAFGRGEVVRYDALSTAMMGVFYADTEQLEEPVELLFHGEQLVVLGNDTCNAVVLDRQGGLVRNFGYPEMRYAHDIAFGPDGLLYVALDSHPQLGTAVQVWDVDGGALVRHFGTLDQIASATGLAFGTDGALYVTDYERHAIVRFDVASGAVRDTFRDVVMAPVGIELGSDGALYVVDAAGVQRLDADDGARLGTFVAVGDGHLSSERSITFVRDASLAAARR